MKQYVGCRYSPGYAACPDLAMNRDIFDLLNPEEFGIELSETFKCTQNKQLVLLLFITKKQIIIIFKSKSFKLLLLVIRF